jgi:HAD superfamily hydrolase (TIGR01509 family)
MKKNLIKAVVFDYGGVIKINENSLSSEICEYLKIDKEDWKKQYYLYNHLFNVGNTSFEDLFTLVASKFDNSEKTRKHVLNLIEVGKNKYHINLELIDIIKDLRKRKYRTGLLSNNSIELRKRLHENQITDIFDIILISAEVGYQKPQPEIFEILFKELGVKNSEVVLVDDSLKSLEGSGKIGYIPLLYKNNTLFKSELSDILNIKI